MTVSFADRALAGRVSKAKKSIWPGENGNYNWTSYWPYSVGRDYLGTCHETFCTRKHTAVKQGGLHIRLSLQNDGTGK